jgi:hypothetical protein
VGTAGGYCWWYHQKHVVAIAVLLQPSANRTCLGDQKPCQLWGQCHIPQRSKGSATGLSRGFLQRMLSLETYLTSCQAHMVQTSSTCVGSPHSHRTATPSTVLLLVT